MTDFSQRGALFDWDGVVIDSHDQHMRSWCVLAEELGRAMDMDLFKATFGMRNQQIMPFLGWAEEGDGAAIAALGHRKEEIYRELIRADGIEPLPGVRELLAALAEAGVPSCVATSTPRENVACVFEMTGLADAFVAVCSAEDVTDGKPAPDVFLLAASKLNRAPEDCVVFEDAHVGIEAGLAAGARVVAVATTHPLAEIAKTAHLAVESLRGLSLADAFGPE